MNMKEIIVMIIGTSFITSVVIVFSSFLKKDSTNIKTKIVFASIMGVFLLVICLGKSESVFKFPGVEISYKGENHNIFEAKNTSPEKPTAFYVSASSTHPSSNTLVLFSENKYVNEVGKSDDGRNRFYLINLPPGAKLEGASPSVVRLEVLPSVGDWGRTWGTDRK